MVFGCLGSTCRFSMILKDKHDDTPSAVLYGDFESIVTECI